MKKIILVLIVSLLFSYKKEKKSTSNYYYTQPQFNGNTIIDADNYEIKTLKKLKNIKTVLVKFNT